MATGALLVQEDLCVPVCRSTMRLSFLLSPSSSSLMRSHRPLLSIWHSSKSTVPAKNEYWLVSSLYVTQPSSSPVESTPSVAECTRSSSLEWVWPTNLSPPKCSVTSNTVSNCLVKTSYRRRAGPSSR